MAWREKVDNGRHKEYSLIAITNRRSVASHWGTLVLVVAPAADDSGTSDGVWYGVPIHL